MIKIKRNVIERIKEFSLNAYPNEFGAMLNCDDDNIIDDLVFYPLSNNDENSFSINEWMVPVGIGSCGSVHSHPSGSNSPSSADLNFFSRKGKVHIIICYPFEDENMIFYDRKGNILSFEIIE